MISYVIIGLTFLYVTIQIIVYALRQRKPLSHDDIQERLLSALKEGDQRP